MRHIEAERLYLRERGQYVGFVRINPTQETDVCGIGFIFYFDFRGKGCA